MSKWLLKIELNGEWEECSFKTRSEALTAFRALANDYPAILRRAILFSPLPDKAWLQFPTAVPVSKLWH